MAMGDEAGTTYLLDVGGVRGLWAGVTPPVVMIGGSTDRNSGTAASPGMLEAGAGTRPAGMYGNNGKFGRRFPARNEEGAQE